MQLVHMLLEEYYDPGSFQLDVLGEGSTIVYHVQRQQQLDWVVRAYQPGRADSDGATARHLAHTLEILAHYDYPTERIIPTTTGASIAVHHTMELLVTSWLGRSLHRWTPAMSANLQRVTADHAVTSEQWPGLFYQLGARLGQLHALPLNHYPPHTIPQAGILPHNELVWAAAELAKVTDFIPHPLRELYDMLAQRLDAISRFETCSHCIIHSDCHLANTTLTSAGEVRLIDWDSAGIGAAVTDLGSLLNMCLFPAADAPDTACVRAAVQGYSQYRQITAEEQHVLADAIQLRTLILLAAWFGHVAVPGYDEATLIYGQTYARWLHIYHCAQSIATEAICVIREREGADADA